MVASEDIAEERRLDVSVVIPALDAAEFLPRILRCVEEQTLPPREVIIVDSSADDASAAVVVNRLGRVPLVYRKVPSAFPGHARNLGVALAGGEWIAFLDCRTIPERTWLEECAALACRSGAGYVTVTRTSHADSTFKSLLLAATYGNTAVLSLSGSLVSKRDFVASGGFVPFVRAGEDILWMKMLAKQGVKIAHLGSPLLRYEGFPTTIGAAIRKWYVFTLSNARIDVLNPQKTLYGFLSLSASLLFVYRWNSIFANWRTDSAAFIPNVTKMYVAFLFVLYVIYRGLVRPLQKKVPLASLLPWRWVGVWFVGFCLDLAKAPGLILGAAILCRKKLLPFVPVPDDEKAS